MCVVVVEVCVGIVVVVDVDVMGGKVAVRDSVLVFVSWFRLVDVL
jgi:hypothetical protein